MGDGDEDQHRRREACTRHDHLAGAGEIDFDASIKGAHVMPTESQMLSGLKLDITKITGVAGAAPIAFLTSTVFWLIAAFRPDRSPALTQMCNDLAWITFTCGVPFLIALCVFVAVAIAYDDQPRPVFPRWVARFNLVIAIALVPACFASLTLDGPFAWNGFVSFWVKNVAIAVWIVVMAVVLRQAMDREPVVVGAAA